MLKELKKIVKESLEGLFMNPLEEVMGEFLHEFLEESLEEFLED